MNKIYSLIIIVILLGCKSIENNRNFVDKGILWSINWSPSGKYISTGGNQDTLRLFSGKDFKVKQSYPLKNTITNLKWHPSETKLVITTQGSEEKTNILDIAVGKRIILDSIAQEGARGIGWNFDGTLLGVGDNNGMLTIFDNEGNFIKKIDSKQKSITGLSWHPKKNIVVTVGSQIAIYDFENDSLVTIKPRENEILMLCVSWHLSGAFFVTGDYGDFEKNYPPMLQFWNSNGENIRNIEKSKLEYRNLKWSNDGEFLATASDYLRLWNKEGDLIKEQKTENELWGIDWKNDDSKIVTSDQKGRIIIWDKNLKIIQNISY